MVNDALETALKHRIHTIQQNNDDHYFIAKMKRNRIAEQQELNRINFEIQKNLVSKTVTERKELGIYLALFSSP